MSALAGGGKSDRSVYSIVPEQEPVIDYVGSALKGMSSASAVSALTWLFKGS